MEIYRFSLSSFYIETHFDIGKNQCYIARPPLIFPFSDFTIRAN